MVCQHTALCVCVRVCGGGGGWWVVVAGGAAGLREGSVRPGFDASAQCWYKNVDQHGSRTHLRVN